MLNNTYVKQVFALNSLDGEYKIAIKPNDSFQCLREGYTWVLFKKKAVGDRYYYRVKGTRTPVGYQTACEQAILHLNKITEDANKL